MRSSPRQLTSEGFPELLREIPDAPEALYLEGELPENRALLAVVGSRKYSPYGKRCCEALIEGLRGYDVAIVSGLALGIDGIAHESALRVGLPAVAVLPSGLSPDAIYPRSHRALAQRIVERGGALLSEYPDEFRPQLWSFPARNRIMAGLSKATLLVEASERSGTLITARLAMEYDREVLVVPHPLQTEGGAGNNALLRQGATLVRSAEDILEALGILPHERAADSAPQELSQDETALFRALTEPMEREALLERTQLPAARASIALSTLLIKGLIVERLGLVARR